MPDLKFSSYKESNSLFFEEDSPSKIQAEAFDGIISSQKESKIQKSNLTNRSAAKHYYCDFCKKGKKTTRKNST